MRSQFFACLAGICTLSALAALGSTTAAQAQQRTQDPIRVTVSFSILGDLVSQVCGDQCLVSTIVGPDADAHVYEPTMRDAIAVVEADLVFTMGLGFETWSDALISNSGTAAKVVEVTADPQFTDGFEPLLVEGSIDPHVWTDLDNGIRIINVVKAELESAVSTAQARRQIEANHATLLSHIRALQQELSDRIDALGVEHATIVTLHDAFGYLGRSFGWTFIAPIGIDGEAEPNGRELAALIEQIRATKATALFIENVKNPDLMVQIGKETGLAIGSRLYSDSLSERGGPATSYLAMMRHNAEAIIRELERQ